MDDDDKLTSKMASDMPSLWDELTSAKTCCIEACAQAVDKPGICTTPLHLWEMWNIWSTLAYMQPTHFSVYLYIVCQD